MRNHKINLAVERNFIRKVGIPDGHSGSESKVKTLSKNDTLLNYFYIEKESKVKQQTTA